MNVAIAVFILMGAMTFGVSQETVNEVPLKPLDNDVIPVQPQKPQKNVIVCHRYDAQAIERDLTSPAFGGTLVNE
jgi:hypothetical protein